MRFYSIHKVGATPDWTTLPSLTIDHPYLDTPDTITAGAQIGYDNDALLVHLWTTETEVRAVENGPLGMPCEDSCLEFFFGPMENDIRYFNLEFNSNGCMYLGFGSCIDDLIRLVPDEAEQIFAPQITKREDGWEIIYHIPYSFIRRFFPDFVVYEGKTIRANCYKCADLTTPAHYLSWNPIEGDPFTFHRPTCFGTMSFVTEI